MAPSPFIAEWVRRRTPQRGQTFDVRRTQHREPAALDVAMGRGRHAVLLARAGFRTFGVDVKLDAVRDAIDAAAADGLVVLGWCADLETRSVLPADRFDIVVVTRYLQRDLFPSLRTTLTRGGLILYETFTVAQRASGRGPTSADHLLEPGELRRRFDGFEVLFYEEVAAPDAVARIAAQRPISD